MLLRLNAGMFLRLADVFTDEERVWTQRYMPPHKSPITEFSAQRMTEVLNWPPILH